MKKLVIMGDSYSTYEGYIPNEYATYYPKLDVQSVEYTWWKKFLQETKMELLLNNSWSGSTIGYTGYNNKDCSKSSSFIYRYRQLQKVGFFENNAIDTLIVFGGTNDSWAGAPLGELQYNDWTEEDLFKALPAICYFMWLLKNDLVNVRIVFVANSDIKTEIIDGIRLAGEYFNIEVIALQNIEKDLGHPTIKGMQQIYEQVLRGIVKC